jgi:hypothetical protein
MNKAIAIISLFVVCFCLLSCKKDRSEDETTSAQQKIITGEFLYNRGIHALIKTHDHNFAIVATKGQSRQLFVAMLNSSLNILWEKSFGADIDNAGGIIESNDGGLVIASNKQVSGNPHQINYCLNLLKLSQTGDILWEKNYLFESSYGADYPILQTSDGGFIISVSYHIPDDTCRFYPSLFKISQQGDSLWLKGIPELFNCFGHDIGITPDQGFLVSGPCALSRTDSLGNQKWSTGMGSHMTSLQVLQDGSAVVLGSKSNDASHESTLTKVDANGNIVWESTFMNGWDIQDYNLCQSAGSGFVITEKVNGMVKLIKTDSAVHKLAEKNLDCFSSCGLVPVQGMFCVYTYKLNASKQYFDLIISLVD